MKEIPLSRGLVALVDDEDHGWLNASNWYADAYGYAIRTVYPEKRRVAMHREILKAGPGSEVDHINGKPADNRRANLRFVTRPQNQYNANGRPGTSRYKGVWWARHRQKWVAAIRVEGRLVNLGGYHSEEAAAMAYNQAAFQFAGEYARFNEL